MFLCKYNNRCHEDLSNFHSFCISVRYLLVSRIFYIRQQFYMDTILHVFKIFFFFSFNNLIPIPLPGVSPVLSIIIDNFFTILPTWHECFLHQNCLQHVSNSDMTICLWYVACLFGYTNKSGSTHLN